MCGQVFQSAVQCRLAANTGGIVHSNRTYVCISISIVWKCSLKTKYWQNTRQNHIIETHFCVKENDKKFVKNNKSNVFWRHMFSGGMRLHYKLSSILNLHIRIHDRTRLFFIYFLFSSSACCRLANNIIKNIYFDFRCTHHFIIL